MDWYVNEDKKLDFGILFDSDSGSGGKDIYCYEESLKI